MAGAGGGGECPAISREHLENTPFFSVARRLGHLRDGRIGAASASQVAAVTNEFRTAFVFGMGP